MSRPLTAKDLEGDPYPYCGECVVKDWCKRRSGESPLPEDYTLNPDCSGYILLEKAMKLSGVPREFKYSNKRNYQFDNDNSQYEELLRDVFNRPVDFVKNGGNILLLHPNKGTGKTRTACTVVNEFTFKAVTDPELFDFENPPAMYVKFGEWANRHRQMYQINDETYNLKVLKELEKMKKVPLLVFDDIGSGRVTPIVRDLLYDVVDKRKEEEMATIFTSNMSLKQLQSEDCLGEMITSRIQTKKSVGFSLGGRNRRRD